jgi:SH3-like domain-containing protein
MLDEKKSSNVQDTYEFQNWKHIRAISGSLVIKKKSILSVPLYTLFQKMTLAF